MRFRLPRSYPLAMACGVLRDLVGIALIAWTVLWVLGLV